MRLLDSGILLNVGLKLCKLLTYHIDKIQRWKGWRTFRYDGQTVREDVSWQDQNLRTGLDLGIKKTVMCRKQTKKSIR